MGPETARWGGGLPHEGVVAEKFVPSLESLSSLHGFRREESQDIPDPRGVQKVCAKKVRAHFSFPTQARKYEQRRKNMTSLGEKQRGLKLRGGENIP